MNQAFRLSRIRAPRGTAAAIILLVAFFIAFGFAVTAAASPDHAGAAPRYFDEMALTFVNWLLTKRRA